MRVESEHVFAMGWTRTTLKIRLLAAAGLLALLPKPLNAQFMENEPSENCPMQAITHRFVDFAEGSFWMFRDSATGREDSVFVWKNMKSWLGIPSSAAYAYFYNMESVTTVMRSTATGDRINLQGITSGNSIPKWGPTDPEDEIWLREDTAGADTLYWREPYFPYTETCALAAGKIPLQSRHTVIDWQGVSWHWQATLTVHGKVHRNIIHVAEHPGEGKTVLHQYWLAEGAGIVKRVYTYPDGRREVWELVRWNILR